MTAFCIALAVVGCLYSLLAGLAVRRFGRRRPPPPVADAPGITVLKPLAGGEPGLYDNLVTFLGQDYAGPVQFVFGVGDPADAARAIVQRLMREHPTHDIALVVGHRPVDGNGKIANLTTMAAAIAHPLVVLSDSDIAVAPRYLAEMRAALAEPGVGLVTSLYRGTAGSGLWAELSTMAIDFHFFPSVLLGMRLARARPCLGATMAFTTETLSAIGGFGAFAAHLADDYAIGEAVRATGLRVVVAAGTVEHRCNERSFAELFVHELRWARTIRSIDALGFAGSLVAHPLPFALAACAFDGPTAATVACLVATLAARASLQWQVERVFGKFTGRWLLGPLRDAVSFVVFLASLATDVVVWRGRRYRVRGDGTVEALDRPGGHAGALPALGGTPSLAARTADVAEMNRRPF